MEGSPQVLGAVRRGSGGWGRLAATVARVLVAALTLAACATMPDPADREAVEEYHQLNDPIEPTNRGLFSFNRAVDSLVLKPLAGIYKEAPEPLQRGVRNFLNNLRSPVVFFNDVLQGELGRAWTTLARFLINSTIGVAGFGDPATGMGHAYHNEDFGQTLAVWGLPDGPYLMLPVLGPSNPRDAVGLVVDVLVDPLFWWAASTDREWVTWTRAGLRAIDARAQNYDELDSLERSSLDFYASIRSLYRQRRDEEILNGKPAPFDASGTNGFDRRE